LAEPARQINAAVRNVAVTGGGQKGSDVPVRMALLRSIHHMDGVEASMGLAPGASPPKVIKGLLAIGRSRPGLHVQNTQV
jgi:hypothetical protein